MPALTPSKSQPKRQSHWFGFVLFALVILFIIWRRHEIAFYIEAALGWVRHQGPWAPVYFLMICIPAIVFFIPGLIFCIGAGALFGLWWGYCLAAMGCLGGALISFLIARYGARHWLATQLKTHPKFNAMDQAIGRQGWKIVLLTRISPVFPYNFMNYVYGLTKINFKDYIWSSWLGMIPTTLLYVYLGTLFGVAAHANRPRSVWEWVIGAVGFAATLAVAFYAGKLSQQIMRCEDQG